MNNLYFDQEPPVVEYDDIMYPSAIPFVLVHLACIAVFWTGVTQQALAIGFAIGAGYHRYFSHRAYRTSRVFQFILAFLSQSSAQKSVLWWASKHRHHHLHSDTQTDIHSPRHKGFIYSHLGWIFARRNDATDLVKIADFARYLAARFDGGLHLNGTRRRHHVCFHLTPQTRFDCRSGGQALSCSRPTGSIAICPAGADYSADAEESVEATCACRRGDRMKRRKFIAVAGGAAARTHQQGPQGAERDFQAILSGCVVAGFWNYYRTFGPGRGNSVESTR